MKQFILLVVPILFSACKNEAPSAEATSHLGELHESFVVSEQAKADFERGLLLLHNFEYDDAREAFLRAQEKDSLAIMAYWGEAMSFNHPLWRQQEFEEGQAALEKIAPLDLSAIAPLEADFIKGTQILFGEGDKDARDQAYSQHMKEMYANYPENEEVAAFYALSILGAVPVGRDTKAYEAGAEVAKALLARNPNHPGGLHYLIHSYDDPVHAQLALNAASSYSKVAADAVHALHMPSHIFLAVGMWKEVVSSNIASFEASIHRKEEKQLDNDALSYHALNWLQYGYLQLGKFDEAAQIMNDMMSYCDTLPSKSARSYGIAMKGAYLLETGNWDHPVGNYQFDMEGLGITARAKVQFIAGMQAFRSGYAEVLADSRQVLEEDIKKSALLVNESGLPMCSSGSANYNINQLDLDQSTVMAYQLRALEAQLANNPEKAEEWMLKAVEYESGLGYGYGPPVILKPSTEMFAEWLMANKRISEAKTYFEKTLERAPNRLIAVVGVEKCAQVNL
ncbi:MAG: hypothetical protein KDC34_15325 [Saprospiraceae bacterium]|nr:hypothetical protein [Saprospiraceae bacterium]